MKNDTLKEYIYIEHPALEERVQINKTALQRYQREGWKIAPVQYAKPKPRRGRPKADESQTDNLAS